MKFLKDLFKVLVVLVIIGLLLLNNLGINLGDVFSDWFSPSAPVLKQVELSEDVQILIKESQIYLNNKLVDLNELKNELAKLKPEKALIKLMDDAARRVPYKEVEDLLTELGLQTIKD